jgi:hypothetical protein
LPAVDQQRTQAVAGTNDVETDRLTPAAPTTGGRLSEAVYSSVLQRTKPLDLLLMRAGCGELSCPQPFSLVWSDYHSKVIGEQSAIRDLYGQQKTPYQEICRP